MLRSGSIALALTALVGWLSIQLRAPELIGPAPEVSGYVPLPPETEFSVAIELEKTRFLRGEQILVWLVTELSSGERRAIPAALLYKQRIIFTRPDGTTRVDSKPMPIDGWQVPGAYGSRYPHTLKGETPKLGRWSVVFEIDNRRTAPAEFTVEAPAALKDIAAHFEFSTLEMFDPAATATLVVRNGSSAVLRVVRPGANWSVVRGRVRMRGRDGLFEVPWAALMEAGDITAKPVRVERLGWASIGRLPHATISPGATWRLTIPFSPWLARGYSYLRGTERVTMSTELQIFLGGSESEWRDVSPVRIEATGTARLAQPKPTQRRGPPG